MHFFLALYKSNIYGCLASLLLTLHAWFDKNTFSKIFALLQLAYHSEEFKVDIRPLLDV